MPELPEVHTTATGLKKMIVNKTITDVWSDFHIDTAHGHRDNLKNEKYYENFRKLTIGSKITDVRRIGKNVIVDLNTKYSIIVHMKMTGHLMVGRYVTNSGAWIPLEKGPLQDPYNQYIHFSASLSDGKTLVLSDMRKFASVCIAKTSDLKNHEGLKYLGTDALDITLREFKEKIKGKKEWPIKSALMDQETIAGVGNIYSDEILWETAVNPLVPASKIPEQKLGEIFKVMKKILRFSIKKGGDSKSDYRNPLGEKGGFQKFHKVYGRKNEKCEKKGCRGIIGRIVVRGRSSHFCPAHQKIYK